MYRRQQIARLSLPRVRRLALAIACAFALPSPAQNIRTDGSVGPAAQTLVGPNYVIPQTLGRIAGNNLFHSFQFFGLANSGQSATFTTTTPGLANVISRVTGGTASNINGLLRLLPVSGSPNFFFINPAGVTFGNGAAIDVPGAFHVSTANYLKFPDGNFHASLATPSTFSSAPPEAFGFLGTTRASVNVRPGAFLDQTGGRALSVIGGDVTIDGGGLSTASGTLRVAAVGAGALEIGISGAIPPVSGNVSVLNGGSISSSINSTFDAGSILVTGGNLSIDGFGDPNTGIYSASGGAGRTGSVDVAASGDVTLQRRGFVASIALAGGQAGAVKVSGNTIVVDRAAILSDSQGAGNAGPIEVTAAGDVFVVNGGQISSTVSGSGNGSSLTVRAGGHVIVDAARIYSDAHASGNAGSIEVSAAGDVGLLGGAISSDANSTGNAGAITITAGRNVVLDGGLVYSDAYDTGNAGRIDVAASAGIFVANRGLIASSSFFGAGHSGPIKLEADSIVVDDGRVFTETYATGRAGNIELRARSDLSILNGGSVFSLTDVGSGQGGSIFASAASIFIDGGGRLTGIFNDTHGGSGNGGNTDVVASGALSIFSGGIIGTETFGASHAGAITINAGSIAIDGRGVFSGILSQTNAGSGNAGNIAVTSAGSLALVEGGTIGSDSFAAGNSGSVRVAAGSLSIDSKSGPNVTGISSQANTGSTGIAGNVDVTVTGNLSVKNGGFISSNTFTPGRAGALTVDAGGSLLLTNEAFISSDTHAGGDAGSVTVRAGSIVIDGEGRLTSISSRSNPTASGKAGSVVVSTTGDLSVLDGGSISSDTFSSGDAGTVKVDARNILIDRRDALATGISSQTLLGAGNAGSVEVTAAETLRILQSGGISSRTRTAGNAGTVKVVAQDIEIDGKGERTGILGTAEAGSSGRGGNIDVSVLNDLTLIDGGVVSTSTSGSGNAGSVKVSAGNIVIDARDGVEFTSISSEAITGSTGHAGSVEVAARNNVSILSGGEISSSTFAAGNAGTIKLTTGNLLIDARSSPFFTGLSSQAGDGSGNAGSIDITVRERIEVLNAGEISSSTFTAGRAGAIKVRAGEILIDRRGNEGFTGIVSAAEAGSSGQAGSIDVAATGSLSILDAGAISSATFSSGDAGTVKVSAADLLIDGRGKALFTGISSQSAGTGNAGSATVDVAGNLQILNVGAITSASAGSGHAGAVNVSAGNILIDGQGSPLFTGISSQTIAGGGGNAGSVAVAARGNVSVQDGGAISSATFNAGNAGSVSVSATDIVVDRRGNASFTGISSNAEAGSGGHAGRVEVVASGAVAVLNGGQIASDTFGPGNAGSVKVTAQNIVVDPQASPFFTGISSGAEMGSSGNAGSVEVIVAGGLTVMGNGVIASSTLSTGDAGSVKVSAGSITLDRQGARFLTGISSQAAAGSTGDAGSVEVVAGSLDVLGGATVTSDTAGTGSAGAVRIDAGSVRVDGVGSSIKASAAAGSSGQTGSVNVTASERVVLSNGGSISISNDATVADPSKIVPTTLTVSAPDITLKDAKITAASSGNVAASDVQVIFTNQLFLDPSSITTSANLGDGGDITIRGGRVITLENSQITTSVLGLTGNGGDISISAHTLLLLTGFIQANTAAANASGGAVTIDVQNLVASGNSLLLGGDVASVFQPGVFGFNVIQAAAPTGVSGVVELTTPLLDVTGSLSGLSGQVIEAGGLGRNPCQVSGGSSLTQAGRGGLAPSAQELLRVEPAIATGAVTGAGSVRKDGNLQVASAACR